MSATDWVKATEQWFGSHSSEMTWLAAFGGLAALALVLASVFIVFRFLGRVVRAAKDSAVTRSLRTSKAPGYRILMSMPTGKAPRATSRWLRKAMHENLASYNFGAPFTIAEMSALKGELAPKSIARARRRMAASDADMLIWVARRGGSDTGLVINGLTRGGGLSPADAVMFEIKLPARKAALGGAMEQVAAYLLAKQLQPALANPQSFRPEKMKLLATAISAMLDHQGQMAPAIRAGLEADFCASSVHVAEQSGDLEGLDRVISLRREHLTEHAANADPARALQARMDIGRALLARAERKFDPALIQEAIGHLSQVVEALRTDPAIVRAQGASDAMFKAQTMLESRKRFAVNFGT